MLIRSGFIITLKWINTYFNFSVLIFKSVNIDRYKNITCKQKLLDNAINLEHFNSFLPFAWIGLKVKYLENHCWGRKLPADQELLWCKK